MHVVSVGIDTETMRGKPITFQWYSADSNFPIERITWLKSEKNATKIFFGVLDTFPKTRDRHYILFGHNLAFDMISLFYDRHKRLTEESIENETWYGWKVKIVYANVKFAVFTKGNVRVSMIDTLAYFVRKLEYLGELFCPDMPKLKMPDGLGQKKFKASDKAFCDYAMRDSVIAYRVGLKLLEFHEKFDISLCVSVPHFASKVFRRSFLKQTIPLPPRKIVYSSLSSYHGGKNNVTQTGIFRGVSSLDIKSAYPYAMASFPSFSNSELYRCIDCDSAFTGSLPPYGIYRITGIAKNCKWPVLFNHAFKAIQGEFKNIWSTGFEINEGLRLKELQITSVYGYFYDAEQDSEPSPFNAFVTEFFKLKETATDKIYREFYKLILNALYGKFIQTRQYNLAQGLTYDDDTKSVVDETGLLAGGLFNPFIASLITGHTRAYIHRLEHKYKALHTSTDGIHTIGKPALPKRISLGSLSIEAYADICLIFRNKLYIMYAKMNAADKKNTAVKKSAVFKGYKIIKYALHGFHGTVEVLEQMYKTKTKDYEYTKVNKLRESVRRKLQVNDFVKQSAQLKDVF